MVSHLGVSFDYSRFSTYYEYVPFDRELVFLFCHCIL
jgi:hypothetical protein